MYWIKEDNLLFGRKKCSRWQKLIYWLKEENALEVHRYSLLVLNKKCTGRKKLIYWLEEENVLDGSRQFTGWKKKCTG